MLIWTTRFSRKKAGIGLLVLILAVAAALILGKTAPGTDPQEQPLLATNTAENYDIVINLDGGGITGQASAARLGIARALCEIDAEMRPVLKKAGFLTRDSREVERKKPGQPGARRKFQFSKR